MVDMNNSGSVQGAAVKGRGFFLVIGFISALLSLALYPPLFGVLGVIMGILGAKGGSRAGVVIIVASIIFMGIGLIYSGVIFNYLTHWLGI